MKNTQHSLLQDFYANIMSHNSPMCLMIGAVGNQIVRLQLKFYINLEIYKFFHRQRSHEGL